MAPQPAAQVVAVTGVSGYIGSEIVKQLLEKGYVVRGTVRPTQNTSKISHLLRLADALPGTLELYEADLLKEGDFDNVVRGAHFVLHTASPVLLKADDPQKDLVDPAVNDTTFVLTAAGKAGVKRVILTSSTAAVKSGKFEQSPVNGELFTEADWNTKANLTDEPYHLSKVLAEKAAGEVASKYGFDLVAINPVFVFGPVLSARADAALVLMFKALIEGTSGEVPSRICDVRDAARAHIKAMEDPSVEGRVIVSTRNPVPTKDILTVLKQRFPQYKLQDGADGDRQQIMDNSKVLSLLGGLIPVEETVVDMAVTMIQKGVAQPVSK